MSNRKHPTAIQGFSRRSRRLYRKISKQLVNGFLRSVFSFQRRGRLSTSGFVLPTTVLLILVVALTVGALTFRAFTRNTQVIGQAEQRVIYNAATPAIDRARSKLEFMFDGQRDTRLPGGVPGQTILEAMLLNSGVDRDNRPFPRLTVAAPNGGPPVDPYTLPDEQRIDLNGDGKLDNAWWFRTDTNSDGQVDASDSTIIYSVVLNTPRATSGNTTDSIGTTLLRTNDRDKANGLFVRQGPLSIDNALGCRNNTSGKTLDGWFEDTRTTAVLRKNFQVDALVIPGTPNGTKVTLEFNQDRQMNRGNKWGAWFRNDLEIYPGPQFNWNGAMHTEGSLIIGGTSFNAYLISAPASCLYPSPEASEISVTEVVPDGDNPNRDYLGLVSSGVVKDGNQSGSSNIHIHHPTSPGTNQNIQQLTAGTSSSQTANPINIALDPERTLLDPQNGYTNRRLSNNIRDGYVNPDKRQLPDFSQDKNGNRLPPRIRNNPQPMPYVDDLYRADDRWGPKGSYDKTAENRRDPDDPNEEIGDEIDPTKFPRLVRNEPGEGDEEAANVGLDGYWERRARSAGLRILMGERLELGNLFTWYAPQDKNDDGLVVPPSSTPSGVIDQAQYEHEGDPLYPPNIAPFPSNRLSHIDLHRRALRDNLSAVQSTAIYHAAFANPSSPDEKDYPVACLATVAHPGTLTTLRQSTLFRPFQLWGTTDTMTSSLLTNFFTGVGTNGWEYEPPAGNLATFRTAITNSDSALRRSLQNLANFAGDHQNGVSGAFPPTQEANGTIHPYPALSMWGNFSNLKRALAELDRKGYDNLSVADKTYLQTASCTLGMLASNIQQIQTFDPSNPTNDRPFPSNSRLRLMSKLGRDLWLLMDGNVENLEVLPREQLGTYRYDQVAATDEPLYKGYNARDYDKVPPEAFLAALREMLLRRDGFSPDSPDFIEEMRLAETIMLHYQIRRDRTFGFKPSPAFGFYDFNPAPFQLQRSTTLIRRITTACDPDQFAFSGQDAVLNSETPNDSARFGRTSTDALNQPLLPADDLGYIPVANDPNASKNTSVLARYRVGLSRLCGTIDYALASPDGTVPSDPELRRNPLPPFSDNRWTTNSAWSNMTVTPVVLPKFPALYYIFPEIEHRFQGEREEIAGVVYDHRQPNRDNPYILLSRSMLKNPLWDGNPTSPPEADLTTRGSICQIADLRNTANRNQSCAPMPTATVIREPYVSDDYVANVNTTGNIRFRPVGTTLAQGRAAYPSPAPNAWSVTAAANTCSGNSIPALPTPAEPIEGCHLEGKPSRRALNRVFPIPDYQVSEIALQPRNPNDLTTLRLPYIDPPLDLPANQSTNLILVPNGNRLKPIAVPFLDRAIFDGRQLMLSRTLDIDLGMLRGSTIDQGGRRNVWLPLSGIVFAFREDAVREDAIARPPAAANADPATDLRNPRQQTDPIKRQVSLQGIPEDNRAGISTKPIDRIPDPERRIHGFRLRNGVQIMRNRTFEGSFIDVSRNFRGLSFFTDQPVYIQGDFNLHQNGQDNQLGTRLEEFREQLPDAVYNSSQFYNNRRTLETNFASLDSNTNADRWRPTEILADSITILSNNFCDGTIADSFVQMNSSRLNSFAYTTISTLSGTNAYPVPDFEMLNFGSPRVSRSYYHRPNVGLYSPGCSTAQVTSFHNQNRPDGTGAGGANMNANWDWVRENSRHDVTLPQRNAGYIVDFAAPIKISRTGHPVIARPRGSVATDLPLASAPIAEEQRTRVLPPVSYGVQFGGAQAYFDYADSGPGDNLNADNRLINAAPTRVNSIIVSGINPSRFRQGYGGLHNFPRFLENWGGRNLNFAGALLQLSYTNYATAPFEQENLEPEETQPNTNENIRYYEPPQRLWGYDVGLQFSPPGPAAARFVTAGKNRNEFYVEPPADDPYMSNLCKAAVRSIPGLRTNCPERN